MSFYALCIPCVLSIPIQLHLPTTALRSKMADNWVMSITAIRTGNRWSCFTACLARVSKGTLTGRFRQRQVWRLVAIDRPGYGLSDSQCGRTLLDWPDDVLHLADHLGLERFALLGVSGGGPYAAACAWKIPERLTAVALVSAMGPIDNAEVIAGMPGLHRMMLALAKWSEWLVSLPAAALVSLARYRPDWYLALQNTHLPSVDRVIYVRPDIQCSIREDMAEAFRLGSQGAVRDIVLLARSWRFRLQEIDVPVQLWHGEQDATVPVRIGQALASTLPRCQTRFVPDAGYLLVIEYWLRILTDLRQAMDSAQT